MPIKSFTPGKLEIVARAERPIRLGRRIGARVPSPTKQLAFISQGKRRRANEYHCAIERTQNGKFNVRLRALFGARPAGGDSAAWSTHRGAGWTVSAYFLASSFNVAMKKLAQSLQSLQKNEERLRFWGVERSDDPNVAGDLLREFGLWLDRRRDFPRKIAEFRVAPERVISTAALAPVRRILADSIVEKRPIYRTSAAD
ncbi:MAG TPA: hypothetical protein VGR97_05740 [Candidatus Acidoferrales bacterium]|nr:hypothetical protein [Candidatus Acidoferrales bacterium]